MEKIKEQDLKLDAIFKSVEKTRRYIFWKSVITTIIFLLPLFGLAFIIPWIMNTLSTVYGGSGLDLNF